MCCLEGYQLNELLHHVILCPIRDRFDMREILIKLAKSTGAINNNLLPNLRLYGSLPPPPPPRPSSSIGRHDYLSVITKDQLKRDKITDYRVNISF